MLNNIKSLFIEKRIFIVLSNIRKLNLIKYNRSLQNKLNIDINNYRIYSRRFLKYEDGIWKEYDCLRGLIYEGKYLRGKRNGEGKEYNRFGKLIFEGNYLFGKKNGKINEYYDFGKIKFEGEYFFGTKNGHVKEYYDNGKIKFEGEYLYGKKWNGKGYDNKGNIIYELEKGKGIVKKYNDFNRLIFEGHYINGIENGKGKEYYNNGNLKFEGEYYNGKKWNGKGYILF